MTISQNTFVANSSSSVNLNELSQTIKTFWKNSLNEIVAIGNYLESLKQRLVLEHGHKADREFKEILKTEAYFPIDFAKLCHRVALWYSELSESHRKFLQRFGWGLSPSCLKELTKLRGCLLVEFFSQKQRQGIKLKDIRDFLTQKTKIRLELPITSEHLEIIQRHYNLDSEARQSIEIELEDLDNPTTTNLMEILKKRKFKVRGIFKNPSQSKSQAEKQADNLQVQEKSTDGEGKLYTETELQNAIRQTVEIAKNEFSQIANQQLEGNQKKIQEITEEFDKIKADYQRLKAENQRLKEVLAQREGQKNQGLKNSSKSTNFLNFAQINSQTNTRPNKPKGFGNTSPR